MWCGRNWREGSPYCQANGAMRACVSLSRTKKPPSPGRCQLRGCPLAGASWMVSVWGSVWDWAGEAMWLTWQLFTKCVHNALLSLALHFNDVDLLMPLDLSWSHFPQSTSASYCLNWHFPFIIFLYLFINHLECLPQISVGQKLQPIVKMAINFWIISMPWKFILVLQRCHFSMVHTLVGNRVCICNSPAECDLLHA